MHYLLTLDEFVEDLQAASQTPEMIAEAISNTKKWIDEFGKSMIKITTKDILTMRDGDILITTDGKWRIDRRPAGIVISDTSNFYKSGQSNSISIFKAKSNTHDFLQSFNDFVNLLSKNTSIDLDKFVDLLKTNNGADQGLYITTTEYSNKSAKLLNPYSFKNIKPYTKGFPKDGRRTSLKPMDAIKILATGMATKAIIDEHLTSDHSHDASVNFSHGVEVSLIKIIQDILMYPATLYAYLDKNSETGVWYLSVNPVNTMYDIELDQSKFK